ncbi:MAG: 3-keto-disaccharide hydrolase [Pirellulales bacterium]
MINNRKIISILPCFSLALLATFLLSCAPSEAGPTYTDPEKVDADYAFQGEYSGKLGEKQTKFGVQVIALGKGKFHSVAYPGGLPGDGWNREDKIESDGTLENGIVSFTAEEGSAVLSDAAFTIYDASKTKVGELQKVNRESPTMGKKAPEGAVVLFDGTNADAWIKGKVENGVLVQGTTSSQKFGDHQVHIEFRLPYKPEDRGQGRGNSGIYLQGRYEVQMLDSFGLEGKMNECGGLYSVKDTDFNMCFPPLTWQTYDIDFTAAKYEGDKVVSAPRITVKHNGVVIQNDVELPGDRGTTASPVKAGPALGPVYLQNHGNPVIYRNIWVQEK